MFFLFAHCITWCKLAVYSLFLCLITFPSYHKITSTSSKWLSRLRSWPRVETKKQCTTTYNSVTQIYYCAQSAISIYLFFGVHTFVNATTATRRPWQDIPNSEPHVDTRRKVGCTCLEIGADKFNHHIFPSFLLNKKTDLKFWHTTNSGSPYQFQLPFFFNHHARDTIYEFLRISVFSELPSSPRFSNWTERATNFQSAHCVSCQTWVDTHRVRLMDIRNLTFQPATSTESVSGRYLLGAQWDETRRRRRVRNPPAAGRQPSENCLLLNFGILHAIVCDHQRPDSARVVVIIAYRA